VSQGKAATGIPESPAGRQLQWILLRIADPGEGATAEDRARFAPATPVAEPDEEFRGFFARLAARFGSFELSSVDARSEVSLAVVLEASGDKRWRISCQVEETEPHRIIALDWERVLDFDLVVREATEADAPALAEIERRCPLVLGDSAMVIDRGDDYFSFARLMEDVTVSLGLIDGEPAGINCGALLTVRIGGVDQRIMIAIHTRILPEHQRKGLWGALSKLLSKKYGPGRGVVGSCGYGSVDNAAIQRGFAHVAEKWDPGPVRAHLDCAGLSGAEVGRIATPRDAPRIVEILNACHGNEEMYTPYTVESLTARLERAPGQYSWDRVRLSENAVVGVWPAGDTMRVITQTGGTGGAQLESRRGVVLDYGFVPGDAGAESPGEDELVALLGSWCTWLAKRGMDTLAIFSSEASHGYARICQLARETESFYAWTPGVPVPERLRQNGMYVDAIYF
jgi:hypothetical protein